MTKPDFLRRSSFADLLAISGVMLFFLRDQPPAICHFTTKTKEGSMTTNFQDSD